MESVTRLFGPVFCLSLPRNGTASFARFCRDAGMRTALAAPVRDHRWTAAWHAGDFESIFNASDLVDVQAFAGSPWWMPEFYKVLFHRFPRARFVLFTREQSAWFASMRAHADGCASGDNRLHAKAYRRELDCFRQLHAGEIDDRQDAAGRRLSLRGMDAHYSEVYRLHNSEVMDFFGRHAPHALHWGELEDPRKWARLGAFLGVDVPANYRCHVNASPFALRRTGT
jgi:hypothetical protein